VRIQILGVAGFDRAIQYAETVVVDSISCGVLDSPLSRGMTAGLPLRR